MSAAAPPTSPVRERPTVTATTWHANPSISFPEWIEHGRRLGRMGRGVGWWIGDWLRFGNAAYGERYARAAQATGYDRQSLMNMVYVASSVETARRREKLSFSHHAEIAALDPADQDRWLERAERDRLSVAACARRSAPAPRTERPSWAAADRAARPARTPRARCAHRAAIRSRADEPSDGDTEGGLRHAE